MQVVARRLRIAFALVVGLWMGPRPAAWADEPLRVEFLAVGQGDATLIVSPTGKTVLVDGGPPERAESLLSALRARKRQSIDLVVLTHRHADHLGGLTAVVRGFEVRMFMDAPFPHPTPLYAMLVRALEEKKVPVRQAQVGRIVDLGGETRLMVLAPIEPLITGSRSDVNANSVVLRLDHGRVRVLLAGDAESTTERRLLAEGVDVRATVLKLAHHGSRFSSTFSFLQAVQPEVAIVSAGLGNRYGHPHPQTLDRLAKAGMRIYRTDVDGSITLTSDGRGYQIRTAHGDEAITRR